MKKYIIILAGISILAILTSLKNNFRFRSEHLQSAKLYEPMEFLKVIAQKNKIYIVRPGWCSAFQSHYGSACTVQSDSLVGTIYEYLPDQISLRKIADMLVVRSFYGVTVINNKLYLIGGYNKDWKPTNSVFELNLDTKKWTIKANLSKPRAYLAAESVNGAIYVMYGEGTPDYFERMVPDSNQWIKIKPNKSYTTNTQINKIETSGVSDFKIYIISASGKGLFEYNYTDNSVRELAPPPFQTEQFCSLVINKRIYVAGGSLPTALDDKVYMFDIVTKEWQKVGRLTAPRSRTAMVSYGGMLLFMGGSLTDMGQSPKITDEIYMYRPIK